jgi:predicted PurR-regulated permease PerM
LVGWSRSAAAITLPAAPDWLDRIPLAGPLLERRWEAAAAASPEELASRVMPHVRSAVRWLLPQIGALGLVFVHFLLMVVLAAILYARGESAAAALIAFAERLAGTKGRRVVVLAGQAVRGVALGVIGTALIQSSLAGLGLLVSGVPYPGIVTALVFVLCVAQVGPLLVMLPVCGWLYWSGDAGWAAGLLVWSVIVGLLDNVLRPLLIRKGADLPLLLIFAGVIGGLIAFGLIGLFIGPILLAVTYTLLVDWVSIEPPASAAPSQPDAGE